MIKADYTVEFRGFWGFTVTIDMDGIAHPISSNSWDQFAFINLTDPNSKTQREFVEEFALEAAELAQALFESLELDRKT